MVLLRFDIVTLFLTGHEVFFNSGLDFIKIHLLTMVGWLVVLG